MSKAMQLKDQIKNMALINHVPAQAVLQNFMLERLLERISILKYEDMFVLKGGMLIAAMVGINSRTTMDMDVTMRGYPLSYETINSPLKIDITTGDILTPDAVRYALHSNFENKLIEIWAYNPETILAEKVETILRRSVLNTRPRDFYDVYIIMKTCPPPINRKVFRTALNATSKKRDSLLALQDKELIIRTIQSDATMRQRWERYCRDNYYAKGIEFDEVMEVLIDVVK